MSNIIAALIRRIEELERRLNNVVREGRVVDVDAAKGKVRLALADGADGTVMKSPWIKPGEHGGTLVTYAMPKVGQWMKLFSPNGEIGKNSMAVPHSYANGVDQPSTNGDEPMWKVGQSTLKMSNGHLEIRCGATVIELTPAGVLINGQKIETFGDLTNNGKKVGSDHKHTGVTPGGGKTGEPE